MGASCQFLSFAGAANAQKIDEVAFHGLNPPDTKLTGIGIELFFLKMFLSLLQKRLIIVH